MAILLFQHPRKTKSQSVAFIVAAAFVTLTETLVLPDSLVDQVKTLTGGEGAAAAAAASRKRLMLSVAEKEKLLNWEALVGPEEGPDRSEQVEFIVQQDGGRNKNLSILPPPAPPPSPSPFYLSA